MKREPIYRKALLAIIAALCFILPNANAQNMDKGLHLIDMDQFHNAIVVFKDITKQAPTNAEAWYYLGICYSEIENADSALSAFNAGLAADPKNPVNVSGQAIVQHLKKNDAQAKATFMNAYKFSQKKYPNGLVSIIKGYAICKYPIDEFIDAVYKKALANNIKDPNIYLNWGEILYNNKDYGNASLSYQRALSYDENNVLAHYLLGQMYNAARNTPAALADLDAALELNPQFVPAIREKGEAYYVMNKFDDAAIWYAKYIDLTEETVSSLTKYAEVLFLAKKYEKAHEIISKVVKLDPNNALMLRLQGWVSYETKNYDVGISAMNKFFQIRKDTSSGVIPKDYEYYAKLLNAKGQDSLAIVYYQKTLSVDSTKKVEFVETIGNLYQTEKKYVDANKYFEKSQSYRTGIDGPLQYKIGENYLTAAKLLSPADSALKRQYLVKADTAYSKICQASPDKYVGYLKRARLANLSDPDGSKGIAKPYYEKTLAITLVDKPEENKSIILECYQYLSSQAGYAYLNAINSKDPKEKAKAPQLKAPIMEILNKMLAIDPANKYALENIKSLNPPKKPAPGAKK